jgi:hypothetical protein
LTRVGGRQHQPITQPGVDRVGDAERDSEASHENPAVRRDSAIDRVRFDAGGHITQMRDRFGNFVNVFSPGPSDFGGTLYIEGVNLTGVFTWNSRF